MWDPAELTLLGFGSLSFIPSTLFSASLIFNLSLAVSAGEIPEDGEEPLARASTEFFAQGGSSIIQADPDVSELGFSYSLSVTRITITSVTLKAVSNVCRALSLVRLQTRILQSLNAKYATGMHIY